MTLEGYNSFLLLYFYFAFHRIERVHHKLDFHSNNQKIKEG
jgi:hypothetical protein